MKSMLKAPGTKRWKLKYHKLLSTSAFNFNLRRHIEAWINPQVGEARAQTIIMLGYLGWGVQLMCPEGAGLGCCGDHLLGAVGFFNGQDADPNTTCANTPSSNRSVAYGVW